MIINLIKSIQQDFFFFLVYLQCPVIGGVDANQSRPGLSNVFLLLLLKVSLLWIHNF